MQLNKNHHYLILIVFLSCIISGAVLFAQDEINLTLSPTNITAPLVNGIGGTEVVTIELSNELNSSIEFPEKRWLVIEREDKPGIPYYTPIAPYHPLILHPKEKLKVVWRLRQATNVHLASGTSAQSSNVSAGIYNVILYYKYSGDDLWRTKIQSIELHKISLLWIVFGVIILILLLFVFFR